MSKLTNEQWAKLQIVYTVSSSTRCADNMNWRPGDAIGGASGVTIFATHEGAKNHIEMELVYEGQQFPWVYLEKHRYWYTEITGGGHWYRYAIITEHRVFP